jgi:hypothetical protein
VVELLECEADLNRHRLVHPLEETPHAEEALERRPSTFREADHYAGAVEIDGRRLDIDGEGGPDHSQVWFRDWRPGKRATSRAPPVWTPGIGRHWPPRYDRTGRSGTLSATRSTRYRCKLFGAYVVYSDASTARNEGE